METTRSRQVPRRKSGRLSLSSYSNNLEMVERRLRTHHNLLILRHRKAYQNHNSLSLNQLL